MYKVKHFSINGFWGNHFVETKFNNDINIFIGRNGSGKSTFINILQSIITVDIEVLFNSQFSEATVVVEQNAENLINIFVVKTGNEFEYKTLKYVINGEEIEIPFLLERDIRFYSKRSGRIPAKVYDEINNLKNKLNSLLKIVYLSVNRDNYIRLEEFRESRRDEIYNSIDMRLDELINKLISYQLNLETDLSKKAKKFQENVLKTMLFNEGLDFININEPVNLDIRQISIGLKTAYRGLGLLDSETSEDIENHIKAINKAAETINNFNSSDNSTGLFPNDVTPLTLLKRTQRIIEFSSELENEKKVIFKPLNNYIELLNEFHETKEFTLQDIKSGGLSVSKNDSKIPLSQLSSGEKQLIILLTEALLQKNSETIFIADEPELSLHIEWQRKVISSIIKLNPNSQLILATHSPEIVGKNKDKIINMELILHGK